MNELDLEFLADAWSRRKMLVATVAAIPLAAVVGLVMSLPNVYQATATLVVERQQVPEIFVRPTVTSGVEARLQTITQEILSRYRLEELVTRFGLYPELRAKGGLEEAANRMRSDVRVDTVGRAGTTVAVSLSYRGRSAQHAAAVTNALAEFYVEQNSRVRETQAAGTAEFLRSQLQTVKARLDEQELRLSEFKKRHMGELPQQMEANLTILERLNSQLRLNNDNQTRVLERRAALARPPAEVEVAPASAVPPPAGPETTAGRLARLNRTLAELRAGFTDRHPDVIRVKVEIAALKAELAARPAEPVQEPGERPSGEPALPRASQALAEVDGELRVLRSEEKYLRDAIATHQRRVENTPRREQEFQELSRDYQSTKDLYGTLLRRVEEAELAESLEQRQKGEQFRLVDRARPPAAPVAPPRRALLLFGVVFAIGLGVGAAVLAERLDTSFRSADDLAAATAVPVLASIPVIVSEGGRRREHWWLGTWAAAMAIGMVATSGVCYLVGQGRVPVLGGLAHSLLLGR